MNYYTTDHVMEGKWHILQLKLKHFGVIKGSPLQMKYNIISAAICCPEKSLVWGLAASKVEKVGQNVGQRGKRGWIMGPADSTAQLYSQTPSRCDYRESADANEKVWSVSNEANGTSASLTHFTESEIDNDDNLLHPQSNVTLMNCARGFTSKHLHICEISDILMIIDGHLCCSCC